MSENTGVVSRKPRDVVVLIHGIRTYAAWHDEVGAALTANGFEVIPTNYGRMDLLRFLLPVPWFRRAAAERIWGQVEHSLLKLYQDGPPDTEYRFSIIAHSFGTYILKYMLINKTGLRWFRIILTGSIIPQSFNFQDHDTRLDMVLNEVSFNDFWPALAAKVTLGYGATGTFGGFGFLPVIDRVHREGHSGLLSAKTAAERWSGFLRGEAAPADTARGGRPPRWYSVLACIPLLWLASLIAVSALAVSLAGTAAQARQPFLYVITTLADPATEEDRLFVDQVILLRYEPAGVGQTLVAATRNERGMWVVPLKDGIDRIVVSFDEDTIRDILTDDFPEQLRGRYEPLAERENIDLVQFEAGLLSDRPEITIELQLAL